MHPKTWNTLLLILISLAYICGLAAIIYFTHMDEVAFIFALIPLVIVIAGVWGYGLKAKFPGGELEYYPVENIMQRPHTISGEKDAAAAEAKMDKDGVDFLNVVDKLGRFLGVFTDADAHRARKDGMLGERIKELMTPLEEVVEARRGEGLAKVIERIGKSRHSRLPVLDGEKVIGVADSVDIQNLLAKTFKMGL